MENDDKIKANDHTKFGPMQKCPYNKSVLVWIFRLGLMVLGIVWLIYLNIWVAVMYLLYSVVITFWVMPVKHCKFCYYSVSEAGTDKKNGKAIMKLLPLNVWKESYLKKHVNCGKKFFPPIGLLQWFLPIVLIGISFFFNFSIIALLSMIGFIATLAVMLLYVRWKVCPTCAIKDECHEAF